MITERREVVSDTDLGHLYVCLRYVAHGGKEGHLRSNLRNSVQVRAGRNRCWRSSRVDRACSD